MTENPSNPTNPSERDAETSDVSPGNPGSPRPDETVFDGPGQLPQKIAGYTIKRALASGGMGTVYLATQEQPRRTVALKVMKAGIASSSALRRFEYEAQILARLRHPNIAQVYEAGTHDPGAGGVPFFAMEYVPNARPITEYAEVHKLGTRERLDLFSAVCDAVHHGHQKGIIHRDLKPGNILVDSSGEVKIIDFGVARATDSDMAVTTHQTDVGQLIGTLQYMSPEQCEADPHDLDVRSDVYALGVVLYEMLCGQLPYDVTRVAIHEAARLIREELPARPSTVNRTLRGDVETITLKALEKDRKRRYQSAAELGTDIHHYLQNEPIAAHPPSVVYQIHMMARKHKALFGGVAAVFLGLVIGVAGLAVGWRKASDAMTEAQAQRDIAVEAEKSEAEQHLIATEAGDRAQRRFDEVRSLAKIFMYDFHDRIVKLAGSLPARELLVETAVDYLERLEAEAGDDLDLLAEIADGYVRVGDVLGNKRGSHMGRYDEAIVKYQAALALRERVFAADRDDEPARTKIGAVHLSIGDALAAMERHPEALEEYRHAERVANDQRAANPTDDAIARTVATTKQSVGDMLLKLGETDAGLEMFRQSMNIRRQRAKNAPDDPQAQRDLSTALIRTGFILNGAGNPDEAMQYYGEALEIRTRLLESEPDSGRYQRDVMQARYFIADAHLAAGNGETAVRLLQLTVATAKRLYQAGRVNKRARTDLKQMVDALAYAEPDGNAMQEAIDFAELDLASLRSAADADSGDSARANIAAAKSLLSLLREGEDTASD